MTGNGNLTPDRLPPHALEAEQGVLGCALLTPDVVLPALIEQRYEPAWNYDLRHQHIAAALLRIFQDDRRDRSVPVDVISLYQALKEADLVEQIGGISYLNQLQDSVPSTLNLSYYCDVVREKWQLRHVQQFCASVSERVYEFAGDVRKFLDEFEWDAATLVAPLQTVAERHIKTVLTEQVLPQIERHYSRGHTQLDGLPTGLDYMDKVLLGIAPSDYVILAARPGEGKTSLGLNMVDYLATKYVWWREITQAEFNETDGCERSHEEATGKWFKKTVGLPVAVFTLEMTEESLGFRLVFSHAKVSSGSFRQGFATAENFTAISKSVEELCKSNIYLDGEADQTIEMIAAKARRMARQHGIKLFVLDYLQLLDSERDNDRVNVLRRISKKIVALKKRLGVPWLVLAQMNRNIETAERARRPVLSDLKESGSIEQDADKIIFLYHPLKGEGIEEDEDRIEAYWEQQGFKHQDMPRRINALVAKNRNGPTGVACLLFQNNQCRFHDWRQWQVAHQLVEPAPGESVSRAREAFPTNEELGFTKPAEGEEA